MARKLVLDMVGPLVKVPPGTYFLNGHFVSREEKPEERQQEVFSELLFYLKREFDFVNPEEALINLDQRSARCLCLTFDDGFQENYTVIAPVTERYGFRCLFFINPMYLGMDGEAAGRILKERYEVNFQKTFLTEKEVRNLANKGHLIGSHGLSHVRLNISDPGMLDAEIAQSRQRIEAITGRECTCFAYPFGGKADLSYEALERAIKTYPHIFSSTTSPNFREFGGEVINRRHFEGDWPSSHIKYFLSKRK